MITMLNRLTQSVFDLFGIFAYLGAGFIVLLTFLKSKALVATVVAGLVAFGVAYAVQQNNIKRLGNLLGGDLHAIYSPANPIVRSAGDGVIHISGATVHLPSR